jgi:HEAT repeat protein
MLLRSFYVVRSFKFFFARARAHAFEVLTKRIENQTKMSATPNFICFVTLLTLFSTLSVASQTTDSQLISQFQSEQNPHIRGRILAGLAASCQKNCVNVYAKGLSDSDPIVRNQAVQALGNVGSSQAIGLLRGVLQNDSNPGVRLTAAFWLGGLRDTGSVGVLSKALLGDQDPHVRAQAAQSLKLLGTSAAMRALQQAQNDVDVRVQKAANGQ